MARIPGLRRILRITRDRSADIAAIDDELRFHIETRRDDLVARGIPVDQARDLALREFGDWRRWRGDVVAIDHRHEREIRMRELIESVRSDVRHAWRGLRAQPGFTLVAVATLALGIGATTSVFGAVEGVLLRPLPYADADRIVHVGERDIASPGPGGTTSYDNFDDWRRSAHSFSALGIVGTYAPTLTGHGDPIRVRVANVSSELFDVFHVTPALGRRIVPSDNVANAAPVALVAYDFWRTRLGGDPGIVGQTLLLNFSPVKVVGVLPPGFTGPGRMNRPIWSNFVNDTTDGRSGRSKDVYGLLKPGVTIEQAQSELTALSRRLGAAYPTDDKGEMAIVDRLLDLTVGDIRRPLYLLVGASLLVLLIACSNISNLLLARGTARRRELAVRTALGAGRLRIVRQLLTECSLLVALGAAAGVLVARIGTASLRSIGPAVFQRRPPALDLTVLAATIVIAAATTLVVGLVPAARLVPRDPQSALRNAWGRVTSDTSRKTRGALAVTQFALAVVLLSGSLLVIKSFARVLEVDPGIRTDHLLSMQITLPRARYDSAKSTMFYDELMQRLRGAPGVEAVATTSLVPLSGDFDRIGITRIAGAADRAGSEAAEGDRYVVSPSYFATMGVRLVRGRSFEAGDLLSAPFVVLVDEVFARRIFGGMDPIGRRMQVTGGWATIVGVVTHVKTYGLDAASPGQIYISSQQYPWRWSALVIRASGDPMALEPVARRIVHELDPDQPIDDVATVEGYLRDSLRARKFTLELLGAFAAAALALAVIGLYGVIAYGVTLRRRELGIRIALGAQRGQIARRVLGDGALIALAGMAVGLVGALASGRAMSSLLFEVSPRDGVVFTLVCAVMLAVALAASFVPARRATLVDATEVLRGD